MRLPAAALTTSHLIEHDDVVCRVLDLDTTRADAVLVHVLPETAFADPIILHFWRTEEVDTCGWTC